MSKLLLTDTQKRKKMQGLCITPFCLKKARGKGHYKCHSCIQELKKINNPLKYVYDTWQMNCRRRKKVNTVTFEEFKIFVGETNYMRKRGRGSKKFNIARREECNDDCPREWCQAHGYHAHNIKSITLAENLRERYYKEKKFAGVPF
jgi:hypothetical protein